MKGRTVRVTEKAFESLSPARAYLIDAAKDRRVITYGELIREADLPYRPQGIGRFLDVLSEDCFRRDEPSLAAIVVNSATGEVGEDFDGDPVAERNKVYERWA